MISFECVITKELLLYIVNCMITNGSYYDLINFINLKRTCKLTHSILKDIIPYPKTICVNYEDQIFCNYTVIQKIISISLYYYEEDKDCIDIQKRVRYALPIENINSKWCEGKNTTYIMMEVYTDYTTDMECEDCIRVYNIRDNILKSIKENKKRGVSMKDLFSKGLIRFE